MGTRLRILGWRLHPLEMLGQHPGPLAFLKQAAIAIKYAAAVGKRGGCSLGGEGYLAALRGHLLPRYCNVAAISDFAKTRIFSTAICHNRETERRKPLNWITLFICMVVLLHRVSRSQRQVSLKVDGGA